MLPIFSLEDLLGKRVIGQTIALEMISQRIQTSRARLDDPEQAGRRLHAGGTQRRRKNRDRAGARPTCSMAANTTSSPSICRSSRKPHTVSTLKGSPPGYVGYGEGGVLTEAVRRRPYSVVLLDEVEKAHPDVLELFFQVFDKGNMEDGEGRRDRFQEQHHHSDHQRLHRSADEVVRRSGNRAQPAGSGARRSSRN